MDINNNIPDPPMELMEDEADGNSELNFEIIEDFGDDDKLPLFANKENRELQGKVDKIQIDLEETNRIIEEYKERIKVMRLHLIAVKQELDNTQQLYRAKVNEYETETHMKQLSEREKGRIRQEISKITQEIIDVQDRLNIAQNALFQANEKYEQFRIEMNWNQEELTEWTIGMKQKEEDLEQLSKYAHEDDFKVRDLLLEVEKITMELVNKRNQLENEITETQTKQIEVDKAAEEFRKLHKQRQELIRQWNDAVAIMNRRDKDIHEGRQRYIEGENEYNHRKQSMENEQKHLNETLKLNSLCQGRINTSERILDTTRTEYANILMNQNTFKEELEVSQNELSKVAGSLNLLRKQIKIQLSELENKKQQLKFVRDKFQSTIKQYESERNVTLTKEQIMQRAEKQLNDNELEKKHLEKQLDILKNQQFNITQELFDHRQKEASLVSEIAGSESASRNMQVQIHKLDQESIRQQELIYNAEFQIQQLERKVARAKGVRSDEEKEVLQKKIKELEKIHDEKVSQKKILDGQSKTLHEELKRYTRELIMLKEEHSKCINIIKEKELQITTSDIEFKRCSELRDDTIVRHDVLKMEVKKLREELGDKITKVNGLENRKEQLRYSMDERRKEIKSYLDIQIATCKVIDEERHKLSLELQGRLSKLETLKSKYETMARTATIGEDGEQSQAYYIIKAAQKREELQRKGDELDHNIKEAEKELRALQETLKHLNGQNTRYRESFRKIDKTGDIKSIKDLKEMEEKVMAGTEVLLKRQKELKKIHSDYLGQKSKTDQQSKQNETNKQTLIQLQTDIDNLDNSVNETEIRLEDIQRKLRTETILYRRTSGNSPDEQTIPEKAMLADHQNDRNKSILYSLHNLVKEYPDLESSFISEIQEHNLEIPARPTANQ